MYKIIVATTALCAFTALAYGADLSKTELPKIHETYAANPARFAHNYIGKPFTSSMVVMDIVETAANPPEQPRYTVTLGAKSEVSCSNVKTDDVLAFNRGDTVDVTGAIAERAPGIIKLDKCTFSRSVPSAAAEPLAAPPIVYAPAPAPAPAIRPQTVYLYGSPAARKGMLPYLYRRGN